MKISTHNRILSLYNYLLILLLSFNGINAYSSQNKITGIVVNGNQLLKGAEVKIKASGVVTQSDNDGRFILEGDFISDSVIVSAWAEGYFNGEAKAISGDTNVIISLHPLFLNDNVNYEWISPFPDKSKPLNCGNCHSEVILNQWENNAHGQSAKNPFFLAMYNGTDFEGNSEVGVGYKLDFRNTTGNCATCHVPGAAVHDPWSTDPNLINQIEKNGVFCDVCHKVFDTEITDGQGTTGILSIDFLRPPDEQQVFFGPYIDVHYPDSYLPKIKKSEFCAPCHTGRFWNQPTYQSFPEWKASPYSAMGIQCQACHMAPDSITTNFAPGHGGIERNELTIPSHLQPGSRDSKILQNSVTMSVSSRISSDTLQVMVTIINDQTGHHVPTGRPSRNLILLVTANDEKYDKLEFIQGEIVPHWGGQGDPDFGNYASLPGKGFAKILQDNDSGISPSPSWKPHTISEDNRIEAFKTDTSYYYFKLPETGSVININAKLIYRRFFKEWMKEKNFEIDDIEMENEKLIIPNPLISQTPRLLNSLVDFWIGKNAIYGKTVYINFDLNVAQNIVIELFDIQGNKLKSVVDGFFFSGLNRIPISLSEFSGGIYFFRLKMDGVYKSEKVIIY